MTSIPKFQAPWHYFPGFTRSGRSKPTDGGREKEVTTGEMNTLGTRLSGRRIAFSHLWEIFIRYAWLALFMDPLSRIRQPRNTDERDRLSGPVRSKPTHRNLKANERAHHRRVWRRRNR